jgi:hypothetical protein
MIEQVKGTQNIIGDDALKYLYIQNFLIINFLIMVISSYKLHCLNTRNFLINQ